MTAEKQENWNNGKDTDSTISLKDQFNNCQSKLIMLCKNKSSLKSYLLFCNRQVRLKSHYGK